MSVSVIILIALALGIIVGGVMVLKKSAKKFDLTKKQLKDIKERNVAMDTSDELYDGDGGNGGNDG